MLISTDKSHLFGEFLENYIPLILWQLFFINFKAFFKLWFFLPMACSINSISYLCLTPQITYLMARQGPGLLRMWCTEITLLMLNVAWNFNFLLQVDMQRFTVAERLVHESGELRLLSMSLARSWLFFSDHWMTEEHSHAACQSYLQAQLYQETLRGQHERHRRYLKTPPGPLWSQASTKYNLLALWAKDRDKEKKNW